MKEEEIEIKTKKSKTNLLRGALKAIKPDVLGALGDGVDAHDRGAAGLFYVFCFGFIVFDIFVSKRG